MSASQEQMGNLSRDEAALASRITSADLLAFLDSQRVTVGPPIRPDGSGWLIAFDADAHVVTAWGAGNVVKMEMRCASMTEALHVVRRYEHLT